MRWKAALKSMVLSKIVTRRQQSTRQGRWPRTCWKKTRHDIPGTITTYLVGTENNIPHPTVLGDNGRLEKVLALQKLVRFYIRKATENKPDMNGTKLKIKAYVLYGRQDRSLKQEETNWARKQQNTGKVSTAYLERQRHNKMEDETSIPTVLDNNGRYRQTFWHINIILRYTRKNREQTAYERWDI